MAKLSDINLLDVGNVIQLAGAVYVGRGKVYLAMLPDERGSVFVRNGKPWFNQGSDESELQELDMSQDDWATFIRQTDLLETEVLARQADGTIQKAILRKSQRQIEQGVSWKVFKRDGYTCRYCGNEDTPLTVDHLVCWEAGGPSIVDNLIAACRKCNKTRGDLPYEEWLKHPYYRKVSQNLDDTARQANLAIVETLDRIPRHQHKRSR